MNLYDRDQHRSLAFLYGGHDNTGVQRTPPVLEQRAVRHLVRERMLERVLRIWKERIEPGIWSKQRSQEFRRALLG